MRRRFPVQSLLSNRHWTIEASWDCGHSYPRRRSMQHSPPSSAETGSTSVGSNRSLQGLVVGTTHRPKSAQYLNVSHASFVRLTPSPPHGLSTSRAHRVRKERFHHDQYEPCYGDPVWTPVYIQRAYCPRSLYPARFPSPPRSVGTRATQAKRPANPRSHVNRVR